MTAASRWLRAAATSSKGLVVLAIVLASSGSFSDILPRISHETHVRSLSAASATASESKQRQSEADKSTPMEGMLLQTQSSMQSSHAFAINTAATAASIGTDAVTLMIEQMTKLLQTHKYNQRAGEHQYISKVPLSLYARLSDAQRVYSQKVCYPLQHAVVAAANYSSESGYFGDGITKPSDLVLSMCPQAFLAPIPDLMASDLIEARQGTAVASSGTWRNAVRQTIVNGIRQAAKEELFHGQVAAILASAAIPACYYEPGAAPTKRLRASSTCASKLLPDEDLQAAISDDAKKTHVRFDYESRTNATIPLAEHAMRAGNVAPLRNVLRSGGMAAFLPFVRRSASSNWVDSWCAKLTTRGVFWTDTTKQRAFQGLLQPGHSLSRDRSKNVKHARPEHRGTVQAMQQCLMFGERSKILPEDQDSTGLLGAVSLAELGLLSPGQAAALGRDIVEAPMSIDALLFQAGVQVPAHDIFGEAHQVMRASVKEGAKKAYKKGKAFDPLSVAIPEAVNDVLALIQIAVAARADTFERRRRPSDYFDPTENLARLAFNAQAAADAIAAHKKSGKIKRVMKRWTKAQMALDLTRIASITISKAFLLANEGDSIAFYLAEAAGGSEAAKYSTLTVLSLLQSTSYALSDREGRETLKKLQQTGEGGLDAVLVLLSHGALGAPAGEAMSGISAEGDKGEFWRSTGKIAVESVSETPELIEQIQGIVGASDAVEYPAVALLNSLQRCSRAMRDGYPLSRVVLGDFARVLRFADGDTAQRGAVQVPGGIDPYQGDECGDVVMALGNFVPSQDEIDAGARSKGFSWKKLLRSAGAGALWLAKGPGLKAAELALATKYDVLGSKIFPVLGLLRSLGKLVVASYKLHRERLAQHAMHAAAPLQHTKQYNDALYVACNILRDQRESLMVTAAATQTIIGELPPRSRDVLTAAAADGLTEMALALDKGLASAECLGKQPEGPSQLPVFVRPEGNGVTAPQQVVVGVTLRNMVTCTQAPHGAGLSCEATRPPATARTEGVQYRSLLLAAPADHVGGALLDSDQPQPGNGLGGSPAVLGVLQIAYSASTDAEASVTGLYGGILTARSKAYHKQSFLKRQIIPSFDFRVARVACGADQAAAGASQWSQTEYYGIGEQPKDIIERYNWDLERVEEWAREQELGEVAEPGLMAVPSGVVPAAGGGWHAPALPSQPFEGLIEGCGKTIGTNNSKYEARAFLYSQSGGGAPLESILLAHPGMEVNRHGELPQDGSSPAHMVPAASIGATRDELLELSKAGKLSYSLRVVLPAPSSTHRGNATGQVCLPPMTRTGKKLMQAAPFDGCGLGKHGWSKYSYEELSLIVTKNYVVRPEASTAKIREQFRGHAGAVLGLGGRTRAESCREPGSNHEAPVCSGHGACSLSLDLDSPVRDHAVRQQAPDSDHTESMLHMEWVCLCESGYSGPFCSYPSGRTATTTPPLALSPVYLISSANAKTKETRAAAYTAEVRATLKKLSPAHLRKEGAILSSSNKLARCWHELTSGEGALLQMDSGDAASRPEAPIDWGMGRQLLRSGRTGQEQGRLKPGKAAQASSAAKLRFSSARAGAESQGQAGAPSGGGGGDSGRGTQVDVLRLMACLLLKKPNGLEEKVRLLQQYYPIKDLAGA